MNADTNKGQQQQNQGSPPANSGQLKCAEFQSLMIWQLDRYRKAVVENRWFMSQKYSRFIDWEEAEQDFVNQGYYGCAEKWRHEYCGEICPFKNHCLLAIRLEEVTEPIPLPITG